MILLQGQAFIILVSPKSFSHNLRILRLSLCFLVWGVGAVMWIPKEENRAELWIPEEEAEFLI